MENEIVIKEDKPKRRYYILSILLLIFLCISIYAITIQNNKGTEANTPETTVATGNQEFDLNINALTYQLPDYTKICLPESRYDCSTKECIKNKPIVFILYDEYTNKVYRCDKNPCDQYDVSKETSGLYTNLTPIIPNGSLIKLSNDNKYTEIVSIGLDFIIYMGQCNNKK